MKKARAVASGVILAATIGGSLLLASPASAADVAFADPALAACVNSQLGTPSTAPVTATQAASLTKLQCINWMITSLEGIQAFTSLKSLFVGGDPSGGQGSGLISDLSPLSELTQLEDLELPENNISDLTDLSPLTNLTTLFLANNQISDLSPVAGMTALTDISVGGNEISDVSVMAGWPDLARVEIGYNHITDLSPLHGLTKMVQIQAVEQTITLPALPAGQSQTNPVRNDDGLFQPSFYGGPYFVLAGDAASWTFATAADNTITWESSQNTTTQRLYLFTGTIRQKSLAGESLPTTLVDDAANTTVGQAVTIDVLANDGLPNEPALDAATMTLLDDSGNPTTQIMVDGGAFEVIDSAIVFTPLAGFTGTAVTNYQATNTDGVLGQASIRVNVTTETIPTTNPETGPTAAPSQIYSAAAPDHLASTGFDGATVLSFGALTAIAGILLLTHTRRRRA